MKKLTCFFVSLISMALPLSASAAIYDVVFSGAVYEYADENGDFFQADSDFANCVKSLTGSHTEIGTPSGR